MCIGFQEVLYSMTSSFHLALWEAKWPKIVVVFCVDNIIQLLTVFIYEISCPGPLQVFMSFFTVEVTLYSRSEITKACKKVSEQKIFNK